MPERVGLREQGMCEERSFEEKKWNLEINFKMKLFLKNTETYFWFPEWDHCPWSWNISDLSDKVVLPCPMEMCPQTWSGKRQKAKVEKIKIARERQQIEGNKMKEMQWNMLKVKLEM